MNIYEFADVIDKKLVITRYPNQNGRFSANFDHCEIRQNGCLVSAHGNGWTPNEATNAYASIIQECTLIFNAYDSDYRQTYVVPKLEGV